MKQKTLTWTQTVTLFDVGEKVKPTSNRCPLEPGEYTVKECLEPRHLGDPVIVFVEGHITGIKGTYLTSVS